MGEELLQVLNFAEYCSRYWGATEADSVSGAFCVWSSNWGLKNVMCYHVMWALGHVLCNVMLRMIPTRNSQGGDPRRWGVRLQNPSAGEASRCNHLQQPTSPSQQSCPNLAQKWIATDFGHDTDNTVVAHDRPLKRRAECTSVIIPERPRTSRVSRPCRWYARLITSGEPVNAAMASGPHIFKGIVRRLFQLPASSNFTINYTDKDKDEMTIGSDCDIYYACALQKLNPVRCTVLLQEEESRSSAHDSRPPGPLTVDPPQWAVDISLKLDQLLLAVNKLLVVPVAASGRPTSTKVEDPFAVLDDSPIDDPTPKKMEERFLIKGESSIAGPTIEPAKDAVPSEDRAFDNARSGQSDREFLKRTPLLQQRAMTDEVSEAVGRGAASTEVSGCSCKSVAGDSTGAPNLEGPVGVGQKRGPRKKKTAKAVV